jgi:hypothetical protein
MAITGLALIQAAHVRSPPADRVTARPAQASREIRLARKSTQGP